MAGDWIKWTKGLENKREILAMSRELGIHRFHVAAACMVVWTWANGETEDGHVKGVSTDDIDGIAGVTGFAKSMEKAGWFCDKTHGVFFPNFEKNNGETTKKRMKSALRKRKQRFLQKQNVTEMSQKCHKNVTKSCDKKREEQEREQEREKKERREKKETKKREESKIKEKEQEKEQEEKRNNPLCPPKRQNPKPTLDTAFDHFDWPFTHLGSDMRFAWKAWTKERLSRTPKPTQLALRQHAAKLGKVSVEAAIQAIEDAMASGWRCPFPKEIPNAKRQPAKRDKAGEGSRAGEYPQEDFEFRPLKISGGD